MKTGKTLPELITEVQRRAKAKRDLLADTREQIRMVPMAGFPDNVALVTLNDGTNVLDRFSITETAHSQIADFLRVPWKYYHRLLTDHPDLVMHQVNALFEREPAMRMIRTIDGRARAFVSDRYRRIDDDMVLAKTLPKLTSRNGDLPANRVIASHVADDYLRVRVVWTDPTLEQNIGVIDGKADIVKPGFELFNSETGKGSFTVRGFFYRSYCENGCVWGVGDNDLTFRRYHLGGKLMQTTGMEIFSDETKRKDDEALIAQVGDVMAALGSRDFAQRMGDSLRAMKQSEAIVAPTKAVEVLGKEVGLYEAELDSVLENLIRERDYTRWGALNAITALANVTKSDERSFELQEIGAQLIDLSASRWTKIANAGRVLQAA